MDFGRPGMISERQKTIKGVRDKAAALAEELNGIKLRDARPYYNWEVCALLDHIDELQAELKWAREHYVGTHDEAHRLAKIRRRFA